MRILLVLHQFFPEFSGGTERVALNLARMAQRAGHHVRVLACVLDPRTCDGLPASSLPGAFDAVHDGVPVTLLPRKMLPPTADYSFDCEPALMAPLQSWMQSQKLDVLHLLHPMRMATVIKAAQQIGLPYVVTLTDFFWFCSRINAVNLDGQLCEGPATGQTCARTCMVPPWDAASLSQRHRQAAAVLSAAGVCVAPSEYVAKRYEEAFDHLHVRVIPHGIDLLRMLRHRPSTSAEGGPTGSRTLTLGFLGTIVAQKGLGVLLKALAAIPDVPLKLMVAGHIHGDEVFRNDILQAVKADARIEMLGQLDAAGVVDMLSRMDLLCLPSLVPESYSLVLHEAAAAGVPALVSRLGAPEGFIAQTQAGLALEAGDPRAWSQAISRIAAEPSVLQRWRAALPLPIRIEEEAFLYESLYRQFRKSD